MGRTSLRPWFMGNKMQFEAVACRLFLHYSYTLAQKASNYGIFCFYNRIAGPEKALCDKLYTMSPVANADELFILLTEDLRIEESELAKLDRKKIVMLSEHYQKDFPVRQTV